MNKLLIANWKMNPATEVEAEEMARYSDSEGVVICPPFPFLSAVKNTLSKASLGAQDLFWEKDTGPFTGEVSAGELKSFGVKYVIIGHSDRRKYFNETNEDVARKTGAAMADGLMPIVCLGESRQEHDAGKAMEVVEKQFKTVLEALSVMAGGELIVCYEPVWAISSNAVEAGLTDEAVAGAPTMASEMMKFMKTIAQPYNLNIKYIYGGSANGENIDMLLAQDEIEGFLVGGASLKKEEFEKMILAVNS
ncbi:MAG: triose-phosphate isomerase [Candidatus Harrisonbacteria bacterium CG10_big_fil_rev_8_21_14_0_10_45_28]|uniref:Triosephosphate isomerase n=1 Tax=Candidatus Harrisonbacteria bacterium CG10_big_fil_rev_8_21_14_0_10_45_28 TaxID=1974586 RepID=A0A2H0UP50_9BACT|nr:MAG: triose-phosphate isomerase [Candidatus Harrisonbacteria bacterium CG10_big_fil_rev_8_21_14_0_10_45_28]